MAPTTAGWRCVFARSPRKPTDPLRGTRGGRSISASCPSSCVPPPRPRCNTPESWFDGTASRAAASDIRPVVRHACVMQEVARPGWLHRTDYGSMPVKPSFTHPPASRPGAQRASAAVARAGTTPIWAAHDRGGHLFVSGLGKRRRMGSLPGSRLAAEHGANPCASPVELRARSHNLVRTCQ
jgi:hypothetical protein